MDQEKFGRFVKKIRKQNHLTQKDLADKYNVTYQAVSKWENGKNLPDILLIKKMSEDFNVDIRELLNGEVTKKKKTLLILIILSIFALISILMIFIFKNKSDYEFKTLSSECSHFTITGSVAYNDNKSSIYISSVKYCGGDDENKYNNIECKLYEKSGNIEKVIDTKTYNSEGLLKLEDFLQELTFTIDNYSRVCKQFKENNLFLEINASKGKEEIITYKIPLSINDNCLR